jgi:hypothetical protein
MPAYAVLANIVPNFAGQRHQKVRGPIRLDRLTKKRATPSKNSGSFYIIGVAATLAAKEADSPQQRNAILTPNYLQLKG